MEQKISAIWSSCNKPSILPHYENMLNGRGVTLTSQMNLKMAAGYNVAICSLLCLSNEEKTLIENRFGLFVCLLFFLGWRLNWRCAVSSMFDGRSFCVFIEITGSNGSTGETLFMVLLKKKKKCCLFGGISLVDVIERVQLPRHVPTPYKYIAYRKKSKNAFSFWFFNRFAFNCVKNVNYDLLKKKKKNQNNKIQQITRTPCINRYRFDWWNK